VKLGRPRLTALLAVVAAAASACGSDEARDQSQLLPRDLGADLAAQSDSVQSTLELGKGCDAKRQARELRKDVERAIGRDQVPAELQAELRERAVRLENSIVCVTPAPPPPPPPVQTPTDDDDDDDGGKKNDRGKNHGRGKEDD
jgi:hypothetical protein